MELQCSLKEDDLVGKIVTVAACFRDRPGIFQTVQQNILVAARYIMNRSSERLFVQM